MKARHIRTVPLVILLLLCAGFVFGQTPAQNPPPAPADPQNPAAPADGVPNPSDPRYRLAVEVELVNITTTVTDDRGQYIDDLKGEDFQVFEDGKLQKVSFFSHDQKVPVSVGVLIDNSGSMRHKIQQALQTVREIALALSPEDEIFIVTFSNDVEVRQKFTRNIADVQRALRGIKAAGETAAYDAIQVGLKEMQNAKHNKKVLLHVTDGFDTRSKLNAAQTEELLKRSEVLLYAIGIDDDDNDPLVLRRTRYHIYHYMLSKLTTISGGMAYRLFTGRNYALQNLASILLEELHQQYTLSYYPTVVTDARWRSVEVKLVNRPGVLIRTRAGYYVNQASN
jgi:Ca-activated chloride channel homolog